ncbi:hypothetical protein KP77_00510 [Jeotgalibacillus alimentarius]|uniref:Uncharacterized protein n=1 Tax=Jeotgalibacillus alimentarius TaxID=135826 RepID=A0A0C2WCD7_9BACL|nr:hypothetical protein KP77_00510 [Jeotgalibacillus alimentarius]
MFLNRHKKYAEVLFDTDFHQKISIFKGLIAHMQGNVVYGQLKKLKIEINFGR